MLEKSLGVAGAGRQAAKVQIHSFGSLRAVAVQVPARSGNGLGQA